MRYALFLAVVLLAPATPVLAQQRVVVVPADASVVVPARGAAAPPMVPATRPRLTRAGREGGRAVGRAGGGDATVTNLAMPALVGVPLMAAAAAYAATTTMAANQVPGASGGTSAPARTR